MNLPVPRHDGAVDHIPFPLPTRRWLVRQDWLDLAFLHWDLPPERVAGHLPPGIELHTFEGRAWVGVVPFWMSGVRPRFCPAVPGISRFPEINVRTYAVVDGVPGVYFFSLDTPSRVAVFAGRRFFHVPYRPARQRITPTVDGQRYVSHREGRLELELEVAFGEPVAAPPGSLEHFLTERYCIHTIDRSGRVRRGPVRHAPWPLLSARATLGCNRLLERFGITDAPPTCVHASPGVEVVGWWLQHARRSPSPQGG